MWCLCVYINWWQTVWDTSITFNFTSSNGEFGIVFFYSYFIRREIFVVDFFCVFVFEVCIYWIDNIYLIRIVNVGVYMCRWCQQYLWLHVRKKHIFIYFVFVYFVCTLIGFFVCFWFLFIWQTHEEQTVRKEKIEKKQQLFKKYLKKRD